MSEETAGADSAPESPGAGVDPVAVALALGGASQTQADAFLKKQEAFIDDQRHHLREQFALQMRQLRLGVWEKHLGLLLRIAAAFIGVAVAGALTFLVWRAANSNDLVIDAFAVPPDLAAKGLSGPVLAAKLSDKIAAIQAATAGSARPSRSYANGLSDGLKLEIPETGVSLGELDRFLREQLGHDTHVSGALIHTESGLRLSVRTGDMGSNTAEGAQSDLDALTQRMAEAIYGRTQPLRFGVYLYDLGRYAESRAVLEAQTRSESAPERADAFHWLADVPDQTLADHLRLLKQAAATDPRGRAGDAAGAELLAGRYEAYLADIRREMMRPDNVGGNNFFGDRISLVRLFNQSELDAAFGDYRNAAEQFAAVLETNRITPSSAYAILAERLALDHDLEQARVSLAHYQPVAPGRVVLDHLAIGQARIQVSYTNEDWPGVLREAAVMESLLSGFPSRRMEYHLGAESEVAIAEARLGQLAAAEARVRDTPGDCYPCLIARGDIADDRRQYSRGEWWLARAIAAAPSFPFAYADWGQSLLARGQPDAAIAEFKLANKKGPHFADPLEGWGEALMAKNQSHLALAKFAEANKYAPNWGRLHLKWGEALFYAGRVDQAKAEFARAAQLDLTSSEKTELARMGHA